jgi:hypothetical protein
MCLCDETTNVMFYYEVEGAFVEMFYALSYLPPGNVGAGMKKYYDRRCVATSGDR